MISTERRSSRPSTAGEQFSEIAATADQAFFAAHLSRNLTRFARRAIKRPSYGTAAEFREVIPILGMMRGCSLPCIWPRCVTSLNPSAVATHQKRKAEIERSLKD